MLALAILVTALVTATVTSILHSRSIPDDLHLEMVRRQFYEDLSHIPVADVDRAWAEALTELKGTK